MKQLLNLKKDGYLFYAFLVLNRKLLSRNNVEYDKPLYCISLVGEGQVKH